MHSRKRLNERGILLVEALVGLGILTVGMATISALMVQHLRASGTNNLLTTAIALGEQELEDLRSQDYNTGIVSRSSTSTQGVTTYTITTTVIPDNPAPNMKKVSTNVTWTGLNGSQTYALYTIYTQLLH